MRKTYVTPTMSIEAFQPTEYVAACEPKYKYEYTCSAPSNDFQYFLDNGDGKFNGLFDGVWNPGGYDENITDYICPGCETTFQTTKASIEGFAAWEGVGIFTSSKAFVHHEGAWHIVDSVKTLANFS